MIRQFLETRWYINSVFALLFLLFVSQLLRGFISGSYYVVSGDSILIPLYAKSFSWIIASANFLKPFVALLGIALIYGKVRVGWILTMSVLTWWVIVYVYWFAVGLISPGSYPVIEIGLVTLFVFGLICLSHKHIRQQFGITVKTYLFSFLVGSIAALIQIFALEISMQFMYIL